MYFAYADYPVDVGEVVGEVVVGLVTLKQTGETFPWLLVSRETE